QHIGNLSMFVFTDVLRRALEYNGFKVKQVINITDFGHLSGDNEGDADAGEDRMTKGLKREKLPVTMENMTKLAEKYTTVFIDDLKRLNIDTSKIQFPRASAYVKAQIAMIQTLMEKGYAYQTAHGVYFDTARFPEYGKLGGLNLEGQKEGAGLRQSSAGQSAHVAINHEKRNPHDFILWKSDKKIGWDSPWGLGFPGWHIECSAMIRTILGEQIDIHTGGIEHIPIHHNNEIAQSEAATGKKPFSRFWLHRAHIQIEGGKISKSKGTAVLLSDVIAQGYHPLALRYLFLGAHYRTNANFSWEALAASQTAFAKLVAIRVHYENIPTGTVPETWRRKCLERINDDLDTPGAIAVVWEMIKDKSLTPGDLLAGLLDFDRVFGLNLAHPDEAARTLAKAELKEEVALESLPDDIKELVGDREQARKERSWDKADTLRKKIEKKGYLIEDSKDSLRIFKK
ncbi:MAG TPA: class I tRNA ligase family protein, partial [Candidatus Paceibacterota bacterium]|nr:class I tRNA ligase family protein [Candidatus Paceibacterota bacterium]